MDAAQFNSVILPLTDQLFRMAKSIVCNDEAAKDAVQELNAKLWENRSQLDKVIRSGKYETAVRVKDKNETVNIFFRSTGKDHSDMIIVSKQKNEMSIIWMSGKMTKEEMSDIFSQNS
jgi:hypothetical protein